MDLLTAWVGSKACDPGPWLPVPGACWLNPSRNHGPWAARIELRISAFFFFLNNTISHNILHVKLESLRPELAASRVGPPGAMVNACIDQLI